MVDDNNKWQSLGDDVFINTAGMDPIEVFFQIRELQMTRTMRELEAGPLRKPRGD